MDYNTDFKMNFEKLDNLISLSTSHLKELRSNLKTFEDSHSKLVEAMIKEKSLDDKILSNPSSLLVEECKKYSRKPTYGDFLRFPWTGERKEEYILDEEAEKEVYAVLSPWASSGLKIALKQYAGVMSLTSRELEAKKSYDKALTSLRDSLVSLESFINSREVAGFKDFHVSNYFNIFKEGIGEDLLNTYVFTPQK